MEAVVFDPASMYVQVHTGLPIEIRATVANCDIAVEETYNVEEAE
jgi:hypothetical protein